MKISVDPMPKLRAEAERRINTFYSSIDPLALEHHVKRTTALAVLRGEPVPEWFSRAAAIERMSVNSLAQLIVEKEDAIATRANARRAAINFVRRATTPDQLNEIVRSIVGDDPPPGMLHANQ
jgi:hypothetical protein